MESKKSEDYMSTMPLFGLDNPYAMDRCGAQHPTLPLTCERQHNHPVRIPHSAATEDFTKTIIWKDQE
jgi:hypothetical protein